MKNSKEIDALDLLTVLLSYISLHSYEENLKQNKKLDAITFDMETKLTYQNSMLKEILRKIEGIENGKYIKEIIFSDDEKKKESLIKWIEKVIECEKDDLEFLDTELYEISEGRVLNEDKAKELIKNMKPFGMKWTLEDTENVRKQYAYEDIRPVDFWIVMNSAYNDYNDLFGDNVDYYARFSKDFIKDEDAKDDKVYFYFSMIPR